MSNREMIERLTGMIEDQREIIDLQGKAIDSLTLLLHQHISAAELGTLPVAEDISKAARLRREMEGDDAHAN